MGHSIKYGDNKNFYILLKVFYFYFIFVITYNDNKEMLSIKLLKIIIF